MEVPVSARHWRWFALWLPIVVLGVGIARGEHAIRSGEIWRFDVSGYDPRDLLRGHYLRFRIEEQWGDPYDHAGPASEADCACLERREDGEPPLLHAASCGFARGQCEDFVIREELLELDRFYVPEAKARELERRLQEARARDEAKLLVAIDRDGHPVIADLLIDGVSLSE